MKMIFKKIYLLIIISTFILSIYLILNSTGGFYGNWWGIPGFFLYVISGILLLFKILIAYSKYYPDYENPHGFYIMAWGANLAIDFITSFYYCCFAYTLEYNAFGIIINHITLILYYIFIIACLNSMIFKKTKIVPVNKALLFAVNTVMFLSSLCLMIFVKIPVE